MTIKRKKLRTQDETGAPEVARSSVRCRKLAPPPPPFEPTLSQEELARGIAERNPELTDTLSGLRVRNSFAGFPIGRGELTFVPVEQSDVQYTVDGSHVRLQGGIHMPLAEGARRAVVGYDPADGQDLTATMTLQNVNIAALRAFAGLPPEGEPITMNQLRTSLRNEVANNRLVIGTPEPRDPAMLEQMRQAMSPGRLTLQEVSLDAELTDEGWSNIDNYGGFPSIPPDAQEAEQAREVNDEHNRSGARLRGAVTAILHARDRRQRTTIRHGTVVVIERPDNEPYLPGFNPRHTTRASHVQTLDVSIRTDHPAYLGHAIVDVFIELLDRNEGWRRAVLRLSDSPVIGARVVMHTEVSLAVVQPAGNQEPLTVTLFDSTGERVYVYDTRMRAEVHFGRRSNRDRIERAIDEACDEFSGRARR